MKARLATRAPADWLDRPADQRSFPLRYTWFPDRTAAANRMLRQQDPAILCDYNKYVLLSFVCAFSFNDSHFRPPPSIISLYERGIERILRQRETQDDRYFDVANDHFRKDLAILTHRLISVGAELAEASAGVPRRVLLAGGPVQFFRALWFIYFRCGGRKPFFALHAHTLAPQDFNP